MPLKCCKLLPKLDVALAFGHFTECTLFDMAGNLQQEVFRPGKLRHPGIEAMLNDWRQDNRDVRLESTIEEFALDIEELSNGHPGIVGFCCNELDMEARKASEAGTPYSALAYLEHASQILPNVLEESDAFGCLFTDLQPIFLMHRSYCCAR